MVPNKNTALDDCTDFDNRDLNGWCVIKGVLAEEKGNVYLQTTRDASNFGEVVIKKDFAFESSTSYKLNFKCREMVGYRVKLAGEIVKHADVKVTEDWARHYTPCVG